MKHVLCKMRVGGMSASVAVRLSRHVCMVQKKEVNNRMVNDLCMGLPTNRLGELADMQTQA